MKEPPKRNGIGSTRSEPAAETAPDQASAALEPRIITAMCPAIKPVATSRTKRLRSKRGKTTTGKQVGSPALIVSAQQPASMPRQCPEEAAILSEGTPPPADTAATQSATGTLIASAAGPSAGPAQQARMRLARTTTTRANPPSRKSQRALRLPDNLPARRKQERL